MKAQAILTRIQYTQFLNDWARSVAVAIFTTTEPSPAPQNLPRYRTQPKSIVPNIQWPIHISTQSCVGSKDLESLPLLFFYIRIFSQIHGHLFNWNLRWQLIRLSNSNEQVKFHSLWFKWCKLWGECGNRNNSLSSSSLLLHCLAGWTRVQTSTLVTCTEHHYFQATLQINEPSTSSLEGLKR